MAISTYAELQTALANWLKRGDLTARIPEFIALGEARLNRETRLRRAETDASLASIAGDRRVALPATFGEARALWIVIDGNRVPFGPADDPALMPVTGDEGQPQRWALDGAYIAFERPCDQVYSLILRQLALFALSDASPTNALLTQYPDVYLAASMCEAAPFMRDDALLATWEGKLERVLGSITKKESASRSRQTLGTDVAGLLRRGRGCDIRTDS